jgi:hypothetical protein
MKQWESDKAWSDRFITEIKRILGEHLIAEAPYEEDAKHNTDLLVLKLDSIRIGCRIRRFEYYNKEFNGIKCRDEFTIRSDRPSGSKTELAKIIEGWGDYFFYGFSDEAGENLIDWFIGDLSVFRTWFCNQLFKSDKKVLPGKEKSNKDNSSKFRVFQKSDFSDKFFVARKI